MNTTVDNYIEAPLVEDLFSDTQMRKMCQKFVDMNYVATHKLWYCINRRNNMLDTLADEVVNNIQSEIKGAEVFVEIDDVMYGACGGRNIMVSWRRVDSGYLMEGANCNTLDIQLHGESVGVLRFKPYHDNVSIELSRIQIWNEFRDKGLGTLLMKLVTEATRKVGGRLIVFPCPPGNEYLEDLELNRRIRQLRKWYGKLGFMELLPEMMYATNYRWGKPEIIGLCDRMAYR